MITTTNEMLLEMAKAPDPTIELEYGFDNTYSNRGWNCRFSTKLEGTTLRIERFAAEPGEAVEYTYNSYIAATAGRSEAIRAMAPKQLEHMRFEPPEVPAVSSDDDITF